MSKFLNNMTVDGDLSVSGGISSGTVTAQQFSYLSGATSNIQQQITNLTNNTTGKLLSSKEDIVACTDPSYFASATAVKEINNNLELLTLSNASSHNAFYMYRDITGWYQDGSLWDRIAGTNGYDEMEGIFPGCTFNMSRKIKAPGATDHDSLELIVMDLNYFWGMRLEDASYLTYNHIVVLPKNAFGFGSLYTSTSRENPDFTGGYAGSNINQNLIGSVASTPDIGGTINQQLLAEFGNHLKTIRATVSASNDNNGCTGCNVYNFQALLPSTSELFGYNIGNIYDIGSSRGQFNAFKHSTALIRTPFDPAYWTMLRNIVSNYKNIAYSASNSRNSIHLVDSYSGYGLRPYFVLA